MAVDYTGRAALEQMRAEAEALIFGSAKTASEEE